MKMGRRKFLKSIAFAGAIATMGFSGCVSTPEFTPTPTPTPTPKSTPTSKQATKKFFDVGTEEKNCPVCSGFMRLQDQSGVLMWVCSTCGHAERVTEPDILKKYGYTS
ncbi:MAG: hypothetical protein PHD13_02585 [Methanocellales archaeon]|nr:hypothetical protein [Methanocellales archaeon]MDD3291697.1 hypothetical protein [Methanocellales archaeon]MDD5235047.1 hypothetical protein [Methanocellales archaeon]MDD5485185.1 hypothetical protein [Methanocellales archaeon]